MSGFDEFPPPRLPADLPADPSAGLPGPSVVIDVEPPRTARRRTGWIVAAIVLVIAGLAAVGFVVFGGSDDAEAFSLTAAAETASSANKVAYEMDMTLGPLGDAHVEARADSTADLLAMDMNAMGQSISMIIDIGKGIAYMESDALAGSGLEVPTPWISVDVSKDPAFASAMTGGLPQNPLDVTAMFDQAESVEEVGMDEVDGEQVKHFKVVLDTKTAMAASPELQKQFEDMGDNVPETLTYDVYVTEDNMLRRMTFEIEVAGQTASVDIVVTAIGEIVPIELPDPSDVTDMTDELGG